MGRFYNAFFCFFYPYKAFEDAWSLIYESVTHLSFTAIVESGYLVPCKAR